MEVRFSDFVPSFLSLSFGDRKRRISKKRSVNSVRPITVVDWQKEWQRIESIIRSMELSLPDYDADCKEIEDRLDRGEYVGHHSKVFEESYSSHYRIISRQIFEKELRPLL